MAIVQVEQPVVPRSGTVDGVGGAGDVSSTLAHGLDSTLGERRHKPDGHDAGGARDGGPWRGPTAAGWIQRLLHGAPPARDSAHLLTELVPHG